MVLGIRRNNHITLFEAIKKSSSPPLDWRGLFWPKIRRTLINIPYGGYPTPSRRRGLPWIHGKKFLDPIVTDKGTKIGIVGLKIARVDLPVALIVSVTCIAPNLPKEGHPSFEARPL